MDITGNDGKGGQITTVFPLKVLPINNSPIGEIEVKGKPSFGNILTADTSEIIDVDGLGDFSYEWYRDGLKINDANLSSYVISNQDFGKEIRVDIKYTDKMGYNEKISSKTVNIDKKISKRK